MINNLLVNSYKSHIKRAVVFFSFFIFHFSFCLSQTPQTYWNEWINYNQTYYKISLDSTGIYRLDYSTLDNAGFPFGSVDPRNIQLFYRGQEQYIYIKGEADGSFDVVDYIDFYGQKNDGSLDSVLYKGVLYNQAVRQPNPYYSLFSDTSAYFLTWSLTTPSAKRIVTANITCPTCTPTPYFMREEIAENHTDYYYGKYTAANINFPDYHPAEGWAGTRFYTGAGSGHKATFNTSNLYSAAQDNVQMKFAVIGASNDPVSPDHHFVIKYKNNVSAYTQIDDVSFDGYELFDSSYAIPATSFSKSTSAEIIIEGQTGSFGTSSHAVPYVTLKYPHDLDLGSLSKQYDFFVPHNFSQPSSDFTFTITANSLPVYVYDFTNHLRIPASQSGNNYRAIVPNASSGEEKFCVIKKDNQFLLPGSGSIKLINGSGKFRNYSAVSKDSAFIIVTNKIVWSGAKAYAAYRADPGLNGGGGHDTLVADIDELADQFAYGIPKHPFAIRHFADYCADTFATLPQNLFLIGKSVQVNLIRNQYAPSPGAYNESLVPSMGYPTCDNMMVAVLNNNLLAPVIPIGRLAAKDNTDINTYLTKVNEYEHPLPNPDEWMKQVIHLAGGGTLAPDFCNYMQNELGPIIEDTSFGGTTHLFCKNSSATTQTAPTDSIKGLINNGVSLITFIGHSSASILDFNLLPPSQYDNANGRYPFFSAAGCTVGDIHQPEASGTTLSEENVINTKGMIGFMGSTGPGTPWELKQFNLNFYKGVSKYLYGRTVGKCIQAAIDTIEGTAVNEYMNATCLEITLHGDPAIVIHSSLLPDYKVSTGQVYFSPVYVSTDMDSFKMNVVVTNIGRAVYDTVIVKIDRVFVDGSSVSYYDTVQNIFYKDTVSLTLPVDPIHGAGLNKFEVHVLHTNPELWYDNNDIGAPNEIPLLINSGDIIPVYPYEYAIVPNDTIMLKGYTSNPFVASAQYIFEIDTTDLFNSGKYKKQLVTQGGAVVKAPFDKWLPDTLVLKDSMVYFWRVRRNDPDLVQFPWRESSFQYIAGKRGWGQSHFFQFLKGDRYQLVDTIRTQRYFDLGYASHSLDIRSKNFLYLPSTGNDCAHLYLDNEQISLCSYLAGSKNHVLVCVFDPVTGSPWINPGGGYYGDYPIPQGVTRFEFPTETASDQEALRIFLKDTIPCGNKVVVFTDYIHNLGDLIGGNNPATVNPGLVEAFQSIGGTQFSNVRNDHPFILSGRKCGSAAELMGDSLKADIYLTDTMKTKSDNGFIFSETAGPASKWKSFHWNYHSPEENTNPAMAAQDTIKINIAGIRMNGTTQTLFSGITDSTFDIFNLDLSIDADTFPYLKLQAWIKDSALRTPPQLDFWRLYYDGVPDASLNPVKAFSFYNATVQQGDSIRMKVAIENIGDYDMDSLWVNFWVYDSYNNIALRDSMKMDSLEVDSVLVPSVKFSTENIPAGLNSLWVEANPLRNQARQLEQYYFNNIGAIPFTVNGDKINPLLDVTFDGVHIMNGDIVSAKPSVLIKLKDENTFLALNDTSDFDVFLKYPSQSSYQQIHFGNSMTFYPAQLPNNSCKISYVPALTDGTYELKVQAKDRSGNASGSVEYKISFEVINKPSVTSVLNYPNPFSTSTRFVFTLTGTQVPDYFKIQILTITGKIVREINKYELGNIHIGRNITDYAWDGKDEFGDRLANGLYIYRIVTQLDGKALEHRETDADSFFTQGFGKMYLIR